MENINKYASGFVESLGACNAEIMNLSVLKHVGTDLGYPETTNLQHRVPDKVVNMIL